MAVRARIRSTYTETYPGVRRPAWTTPNGDVAALVIGIINQANKYTLNTWLPATLSGTAPITTFGGTDEPSIRPSASASVALAAAIAVGVHNPSASGLGTGVTLANAQAACIRMVTGLASLHVANGGSWGATANVRQPDSADNTANWQCALWAGQAAFAAWLIWDLLIPTVRTQVLRMVTTEATRANSWILPYWKNAAGTVKFAGDTKAEEVAWATLPSLAASLMMPSHFHARLWTASVCKMGLAAFSAAADLTSSVVRHGATVGSQLAGSNINNDGTLVNHAIVHPEYQVANSALQWGWAAGFTATKRPIPEALRWNATLVYQSLSTLNFSTANGYQSPGGTIYNADGSLYFPQGSDHGSYIDMAMAAVDVEAMVYGWDAGLSTSAHDWAVKHLTRQAGYQARFTTGQTFTDSTEFSYPGREQWIGAYIAPALLTLAAGSPTWTNAPAGAQLV